MKTQRDEINVGILGEEIACRFLTEKQFSVVERNYRKKWGEIDIIARRGDTMHFVEVKTVSRDHQTIEETGDVFLPEMNVHPAKIKRLSRAIQSYLEEHNTRGHQDVPWQLDVVSVILDTKQRRAEVRMIESVSL